MKRISFFVFFLIGCVASPLHAQLEKLDEKDRKYFLDSLSNTVAVDSLNERAYNAKEYVAAIVYAKAAIELAERAKYLKGIGDGYVRLGSVALDRNNEDDAKKYFRLAQNIRLQRKDSIGVASCLLYLGEIEKNAGNLEQADSLMQRSLAYLDHYPSHINRAYTYSYLGSLNQIRGYFEKARSYYNLEIELYDLLKEKKPNEHDSIEILYARTIAIYNSTILLQKRSKDLSTIANVLEDCLNTFRQLQGYNDVARTLIALGNNAYLRYDLEQARMFYEDGISLGDKIEPNLYFTLIRSRGRINLDEKKFKPAYNDFQNALKGFSDIGFSEGGSRALLEIGNYHFELAKMDSAIFYYKRALSMVPEIPELKTEILYFLSEATFIGGQYENSDHYSEQYLKLLNQFSNEKAWEVFQTISRNTIEKSRNQREIQRRDNQINKMKIRGLVGVIIGIIFVLSFLFFFTLQKRRLAEKEALIERQHRELLEQKNQFTQQAFELAEKRAGDAEKEMEIALQKEQLAIGQKELEKTHARLRGQDEMQRKIGMELHDSVGAMLSVVKLSLAPVDEVLDILPKEKRDKYQEANRLLDEACSELRRISHELSSAILLRFGLKPQLEALGEAIQNSGKIQLELATYGLDERLDAELEHQMYRMVQELLNNVIKHAGAKNLSISVSRFDDSINIIVEDDGKGFDMEKDLKKGIGLFNLKQRVEQLHGEIHIDSKIGRGTTVSIDIPLVPKNG